MFVVVVTRERVPEGPAVGPFQFENEAVLEADGIESADSSVDAYVLEMVASDD